MESKVNILTDCEHELEVTLNYDEIKGDIDRAYKEEGKTIQIPGFRKGKAPLAMIKRIYGDAIEYKATEKIANDHFWKIVEKEKLEPISTPSMNDLDYQPGEKLSFKVKFEVKPKLELKDYKGLEIEKPIFTVKDDSIESEVKIALKSKSEFAEAEKVENEDYRVTVDLQRMDEENNPIEGNISKDMVLDLSEEKINPQIKENTIGKKVGEKFEFTFTDEHSTAPEKTGEVFKYEGLINKIEKMVLPEATEELLLELSQNKAKTLDEFKATIRENYEQYFTSQSDSIYTNTLLNRIVENNDFEAPQGYVDNLLKNMIEQEKEQAKRQNMPALTDEQYKEQLSQRALWTAKWQIISENIIAVEEIKVEDKDLEELAEKEAAKIGISKEKLMGYYKSSGRAAQLLDEKVFDFLKEQNPAIEIDAEEQAKKMEAENKKKTAKKSTEKKKAETKEDEAPKKAVKKRVTKKSEETEEENTTKTSKKSEE
ncbi:MAG: trigger factor [Melioribacteraceae bacterium]|nr:trigger factor [Melioribacteraceae bacterium]